ncbi:MAG TPA: YbaY family lipoprotein [Rhodanobacteraceae bacterium]|nr:YbaY family lipoprotein [Rhodanobacteraceae bacterium]
MMGNRIALVAALVGAVALVGCSGSQSSSTTPAAATTAGNSRPSPASTATAISGTVALRNPDTAPALSGSAQLKLALVDISQQPNATIASKTVAPVVSLPLSFSLPFDDARIIPADMYLLQAAITDGPREYTMPLQQLVLTQGHPAKVKVTLVAQKTPSEDMLAAFKQVQAQLGGMQVDQHTALGKSESRAWQTFRKDGKLLFVISIVDQLNGDKGRTHTDIAYKDGEPWVVVRKYLPKAGAAPTSIDRAGWDADGQLVLREHIVGDKTTRLGEDEAEALRKDAAEMFKRAGGDKQPAKPKHRR